MKLLLLLLCVLLLGSCAHALWWGEEEAAAEDYDAVEAGIEDLIVPCEYAAVVSACFNYIFYSFLHCCRVLGTRFCPAQ